MSKAIGQRIRELREQRGLTQAELAKLLGCAQTTVANWENQACRAPGKKTIAQVAQIFSVTVDYLLGVEKFENTTIPCYGEVSSKGFLWPDNREYNSLIVARHHSNLIPPK